MKVEYHPAIEKELREIIKYYNKCSHGLGIEFLNQFEQQILKIASMPTKWTTIETNIRRSLMRRFPYVIYYRLVKKDMLRVMVIKHQRRHPNYGRNRK